MDCGKLAALAVDWLPLVILLPAVYEDMKSHVFNIVPCLILASLNLGYSLLIGQTGLFQMAVHMIKGSCPGILLGWLSHHTGRWIGEGDCLLIALIGAFKGWQFLVSMTVFSFAAVFLTAIVMLMLKRIDAKSTLPMVPFLLAGYVCAQCSI